MCRKGGSHFVILQPKQDPYQKIPFHPNLLFGLSVSSPRLILNSKLQVSVKSLWMWSGFMSEIKFSRLIFDVHCQFIIDMET